MKKKVKYIPRDRSVSYVSALESIDIQDMREALLLGEWTTLVHGSYYFIINANSTSCLFVCSFIFIYDLIWKPFFLFFVFKQKQVVSY